MFKMPKVAAVILGFLLVAPCISIPTTADLVERFPELPESAYALDPTAETVEELIAKLDANTSSVSQAYTSLEVTSK
jgi:outer membrane murein-binding lipoprotein Lpp